MRTKHLTYNGDKLAKQEVQEAPIMPNNSLEEENIALKDQIRRLETAFLKSYEHQESWKNRAERLESSRSFRLGKGLLQVVKNPLKIFRLPAVLLDVVARREGRHSFVLDLQRYAVQAIRGEAQELLNSVDQDLDSLTSEERCRLKMQIGRELNSLGFQGIEHQLLLSAHKDNPGKQTSRALYFSSQRVMDIELSSEMIDEYAQYAELNPNSDDAKVLQRMRSDPVYQLASRKFVTAVQDRKIPAITKRICYVLHNSLPYASGGYATRAQGLAKGLANLGYEVIGVTRAGFPVDLEECDPEGFPEEDVIDGVRYVRTFAPKRRVLPFRDYIPQAADALRKQFITLQPEVVVAASNYICALPALIASRDLGIPFVYEVRGFWEVTRASREPDYITTPGYLVQQVMETFVADAAECVATLTHAMGAELESRGVDSAKISISPNACNASAFIPATRVTAEFEKKKLGIPVDVCVIGYIGTFAVYEGLPDLVKACGQLRQDGIEFRLLLVGSDSTSDNEVGPIAKEVQEVAERCGISDWLMMPGRVPHAEVPNFYSVVDIAPFPRRPLRVCEMVSPMKPLEALCLEKAVVVSSVGALAEMIDHGRTGLIFRKGDVPALCEALKQLIADPNMRSVLGQNGRTWVLGERTWDGVAEKFGQILARAARGEGA